MLMDYNIQGEFSEYADEPYYDCPSCESTDIEEHFNYCPNCGAQIEWGNKPEPAIVRLPRVKSIMDFMCVGDCEKFTKDFSQEELLKYFKDKHYQVNEPNVFKGELGVFYIEQHQYVERIE